MYFILQKKTRMFHVSHCARAIVGLLFSQRILKTSHNFHKCRTYKGLDFYSLKAFDTLIFYDSLFHMFISYFYKKRKRKSFYSATICHVITPRPSRVRRTPYLRWFLLTFYFLFKMCTKCFFPSFAGLPYLRVLVYGY